MPNELNLDYSLLTPEFCLGGLAALILALPATSGHADDLAFGWGEPLPGVIILAQVQTKSALPSEDAAVDAPPPRQSGQSGVIYRPPRRGAVRTARQWRRYR